MENKKETILKLLVAIGLFAIYALPEYGKELFVGHNGRFSHPDLLIVVLLSLGLYWKWRYINHIILSFCFLTLMVNISLLDRIFHIQKPGLFIYTPVVTLTLFATYKLMKLEANKKKGDSLVSTAKP